METIRYVYAIYVIGDTLDTFRARSCLLANFIKKKEFILSKCHRIRRGRGVSCGGGDANQSELFSLRLSFESV